MKQSTSNDLIDKFNRNEAIENIKNDPFTGKDNWLNSYRHEVVVKFLPVLDKQKLLDFGCGNGLFLQYLLQDNPLLSLSGYDPYLDPLESIKHNQSVQMFNQLQNIPLSPFDVITALDVIEHIQDDCEALNSMHRLLRPKGFLLVTVPAFQYLYSIYDAAVGHYRRYDKESLQKILDQSGFSVIKSAYFFPSLVPIAVFRKFWLRLKRLCGSKSFQMHIPDDRFKMLTFVSQLDLKIMKSVGFKFPVGFFLVVLARKK